MRDVRELVGEDTLDLLRLEALPQSARDRDCSVLRASARRERIRHVRVDDRDARLGQVCHRAEPLDHVVQLGSLVTLDHLRARGLEGELVGGEVLEERDPNDDHEHRDEADTQNVEENDRKDDVEEPEQRAREEDSERKTGVATV